jgi:UbiD family decarboxylase
MPQKSLKTWVETLDKAGLLARYSDEKRVDELPSIMEANPNKAVYVEKVKDCAFPFLTNTVGVRDLYALALGCDQGELGQTIAEYAANRIEPKVIDTAPCKEVIIKGADVDLTMFPLFLHHEFDGQAYLNMTNAVTRDPRSGLIDQGIYRFMFRSKNDLNMYLINDSHIATEHAKMNKEKAVPTDMPISIVIGAPTLDTIASDVSYPGVDDWHILGGFYGTPAELVKCETNDLTVPANAEIVLEGRVMITEGWVYDEGPYGEFTGTYGGSLSHNPRVVIDCITHRKGAIYTHATVGGRHTGHTDMMMNNITIEKDIVSALRVSKINVKHVFVPPGGWSNIAYASIETKGGGDANQTLAIMLTTSRQWMPKIAYVFDDDINIYDAEQVQWAIACRYKPDTGTMLLPKQNMLTLDPSLNTDKEPVSVGKVGFDCTIPLDSVNRFTFQPCPVTPPLKLNGHIKPMSDDELAKTMEAMIREKPRTWKEIVERFAGQPYPVLYRAFGKLRPKLGRVADHGPGFPYTFADQSFFYSKKV